MIVDQHDAVRRTSRSADTNDHGCLVRLMLAVKATDQVKRLMVPAIGV